MHCLASRYCHLTSFSNTRSPLFFLPKNCCITPACLACVLSKGSKADWKIRICRFTGSISSLRTETKLMVAEHFCGHSVCGAPTPMLCTFLVIEMRGHGHHTSRLLQATYKSKIVMWGSSTFTVETNHARAQKSICRDVFDSSSSVWFATCSAHQDQ